MLKQYAQRKGGASSGKGKAIPNPFIVTPDYVIFEKQLSENTCSKAWKNAGSANL